MDVLVRPERIRLADGEPPPALPNRISMRVDVVVNYGDSALVIGSAAGQRLRMRIAGAAADRLREAATVTVGWEPGDAHLIVSANAPGGGISGVAGR